MLNLKNKIIRTIVCSGFSAVLLGCGSDSDSKKTVEPTVPKNCLAIESELTCFNQNLIETKGSSFLIEPIKGDKTVEWMAEGATAITDSQGTYFLYEAGTELSDAKIYAVHPDDLENKVEITVKLNEPAQKINLYPIHLSMQLSSNTLHVEWLPLTTKNGELANTETVLEVIETERNGSIISTIDYDVTGLSMTVLDINPDAQYQITLLAKDSKESLRSLPVQVETTSVNYEEHNVITVDSITGVPVHPIGTFVDFSDELYFVAENDVGAIEYLPAHPFQLFKSEIPDFSALMNEIDESAIVALMAVATENKEHARLMGEEDTSSAIRFDGADLVVNNLIFPLNDMLLTYAKEPTCLPLGGDIEACVDAWNKTDFVPKIVGKSTDKGFSVIASMAVDAGVITTLSAKSSASGSFDPMGLSRSLKIKFPKIKGLTFVNKFTKGKTIDIELVVGARGSAGLVAPSIEVGMENSIFAKVSTGLGVNFSYGIPKPYMIAPKANIRGKVLYPLYDGSYFKIKDTVEITTSMDIGLFMGIDILGNFNVKADAYQQGVMKATYGIEQVPLPIGTLLHTHAGTVDSYSKFNGNVAFPAIKLSEKFAHTFKSIRLFRLPKNIDVLLYTKTQCMKSGVYRPDMSDFLKPEDANIHTEGNGWLYPNDPYGSASKISFTPKFIGVEPYGSVFENSLSKNSLMFIDRINTDPVITRGVYGVVSNTTTSYLRFGFPMVIDLRTEHSEIKTDYPWVCWGAKFVEKQFTDKGTHKLNDVILDI